MTYALRNDEISDVWLSQARGKIWCYGHTHSRNDYAIRHISLSEVTVEQLQKAMQIAPIVSVQNEYNVINRKYEALVDFCNQHQIVFIPWFPLGGLFGDTAKAA